MDAAGQTEPTAAPGLVDRMPPTLLVLGATASVQLGAAFAKTLFDDLGSGGAVFLRIGFAAVLLTALWRPAVRGHTRRELALVLAFGLALAGMNFIFYAAIDRIPVGIGVTLEFVGPLAVAVAGSRRGLDVVWILLAASGILMLVPLTGGDGAMADLGADGIDSVGAGLALLAGAFWAGYILLSARVGSVFEGGGALALAMVVATVAVAPFGIVQGGASLLDPALLAIGFGVAVLSSAIPYSLELEALRRLPTRVFGVLMSVEPAAGVLAGFLVLGEVLGAREIAAVVLVVIASAGAAKTAGGPPVRDP